MVSKFEKKTGGTYTCRSCGKTTRETGHEESNVELCAACLHEEYVINAMSDNDMTKEEAEEYVAIAW
jgi:hypothetical protein